MQELEEKLIADFNANQKEESKSFGGLAGVGQQQMIVQQEQTNELEVLDEGGVEEPKIAVPQVPILKSQGSSGSQGGVMKEDIMAVIKKVEEMKTATQVTET